MFCYDSQNLELYHFQCSVLNDRLIDLFLFFINELKFDNWVKCLLPKFISYMPISLSFKWVVAVMCLRCLQAGEYSWPFSFAFCPHIPFEGWPCTQYLQTWTKLANLNFSGTVNVDRKKTKKFDKVRQNGKLPSWRCNSFPFFSTVLKVFWGFCLVFIFKVWFRCQHYLILPF